MEPFHTAVSLDEDYLDAIFAPAVSWAGSAGNPYSPTKERLQLCGVWVAEEAVVTSPRAPPPSPSVVQAPVQQLVQQPVQPKETLQAVNETQPQTPLLPLCRDSTSWLLSVREEYKYMVKGGESKSQLTGVVKATHRAQAQQPETTTVLRLAEHAPPRDVMLNPNLPHVEESAAQGHRGYRFTLRGEPPQELTQAAPQLHEPQPVVLLKYKQDGLHVPQAVRAKASLKSSTTSSFVMLQIDLAFNNVYQPKSPTLMECKVSLKAIDGLLKVVDAKGKQPAHYSFSHDRDTQLLTWWVDTSTASPPALSFDKVMSFFARIETQESRDVSGALSIPMIVTLALPSHLIGPSAYSLRSPHMQVESVEDQEENEEKEKEDEKEEEADTANSSRLEYTFL